MCPLPVELSVPVLGSPGFQRELLSGRGVPSIQLYFGFVPPVYRTPRKITKTIQFIGQQQKDQFTIITIFNKRNSLTNLTPPPHPLAPYSAPCLFVVGLLFIYFDTRKP